MRTAALLLALAALARAADPELTDELYPQYRDHILPKPSEESWRSVGWRTSYWAAVQEGNKKGLPVLLWTMNGHPLACT